MSVMKSFGKGIQDALVRPKAAIIIYLVNAAFAAVIYFLALDIFAPVLSRSPAGEDLLGGRNINALIEILAGSGHALGGLVSMGAVLLVLYLFVLPFLYGGVLNDLVRPREAVGFGASFWAGGGKYYGRFLRLEVLSLLLWVPAAILFILVGKALDAAAADPLKEQLNFYLTLTRVVFALFLFFGVKMILDYARIRIASGELRGTLAAMLWATVFVVKKPLKSLGLYYILGLTALAGLAAYWGVQSLFAKTTTAAVLAGVILAQLHILWRSWIKVAYQAAQVKLFSLESF